MSHNTLVTFADQIWLVPSYCRTTCHTHTNFSPHPNSDIPKLQLCSLFTILFPHVSYVLLTCLHVRYHSLYCYVLTLILCSQLMYSHLMSSPLHLHYH